MRELEKASWESFMEIGELDIFDLNVGLVNETSQSVWVSDAYQLDSKLIKYCISCLD